MMDSGQVSTSSPVAARGARSCGGGDLVRRCVGVDEDVGVEARHVDRAAEVWLGRLDACGGLDQLEGELGPTAELE